MSEYASAVERARRAFASVSRLEDALAREPNRADLQTNLAASQKLARQSQDQLFRLSEIQHKLGSSMRGELSENATAVSQNEAAVTVSPEAFNEFEVLFLPWLNQNQEELEAGGSGNLKALARDCAAWARANRLTPKAD